MRGKLILISAYLKNALQNLFLMSLPVLSILAAGTFIVGAWLPVFHFSLAVSLLISVPFLFVILFLLVPWFGAVRFAARNADIVEDVNKRIENKVKKLTASSGMRHVGQQVIED